MKREEKLYYLPIEFFVIMQEITIISEYFYSIAYF